MTQSLDLRSVQIFVTVCEKGSMTDAAVALGITQSAVSQHIKQMEDFIGVPLVDRRLRPIRPTPAGAELCERGRRLLADATEARLVARRRGNETMPDLRLGIIYALDGTYLIRLAQILAAQPQPPKLAIWTGLDLDHCRALLNRDLDMIVTADSLGDVDGLERHELLQEPFLLVLPRRHAERLVEADFRSLARELPMIRYSGRSLIAQQIEAHLRRLRIVPPRQLEFDSSATVLEMISEGLGWGVLTPLGLLHARADPKRVKPMRFPGPGFGRRLTLIARQGEFGSLPDKLANLSRKILKRYYPQELAKIAPWLSELVKIGDVKIQDSALLEAD